RGRGRFGKPEDVSTRRQGDHSKNHGPQNGPSDTSHAYLIETLSLAPKGRQSLARGGSPWTKWWRLPWFQGLLGSRGCHPWLTTAAPPGLNLSRFAAGQSAVVGRAVGFPDTIIILCQGKMGVGVFGVLLQQSAQYIQRLGRLAARQPGPGRTD